MLFIIAAFFCIYTLTGCTDSGQTGERISETRLLLDTYCTITIYSGGGGEEAAALIDAAFEICERLEALLSMTIEGSDVWRINHSRGETTYVNAHTLEVIRRGMEYGHLSDGKFDITIGALSSLWDFSGIAEPSVPSPDRLEAARATVNYRKLSTGDSADYDGYAGWVHITPSGGQLYDFDTWVDLGGIAKGYIADRIAGFLAESGIQSALVDLGGDIAAVGGRPDGSPWRIAVRRPSGGAGEYAGVLEVSDAAVVSSGVYERQFEIGGTLYHHILDPGTGMPAISDVAGATIIARDAVTGEGLSTIAVLAGSERVRAVCGQAEAFIGAVLVLENGEILTFGDVSLMER